MYKVNGNFKLWEGVKKFPMQHQHPLSPLPWLLASWHTTFKLEECVHDYLVTLQWWIKQPS